MADEMPGGGIPYQALVVGNAPGAAAKDAPATPTASQSRTTKQRPSPQTVRERKAEIKRRRGRKKLSKPQFIQAVRRKQLLKLLHHRYGKYLPDDDDGRDSLSVLLGLGLDGMKALELAPWAESEVDELANEESKNWRTWSGDIGKMIGRRMAITAQEKIDLKLTHLGCKDTDADAEAAKHRKERARERNRLLQQHKRAGGRPGAQSITDPWDLVGKRRYRRAAALGCRPLADGQWWTINQLCEAAVSMPLGAFGKLHGKSLAQAVRRALRQLKGFNLIETKPEPAPNRLDALSARLICRAQNNDEPIETEPVDD
jgi:hypothetical protein